MDEKHRPRRVEVLGVPVDCVTMSDALDVVEGLIRSGSQGAVIAVNPEKVIKAGEDPALIEHLRNAALLIPDGIGIVWAVHLLYGVEIERVPGAELMPAICERAAKAGYRIFLYGASPQVNQAACKALKVTYPELDIAGASHGFRSADEMPELIDEINASQADILFIALGSPRQELWMAEYLSQTCVKVCQGVGGTFDVLAGSVARAPASWRKRNLEWAFRLLSQPRRLVRQTALPRFVLYVLGLRLRGWRNQGRA